MRRQSQLLCKSLYPPLVGLLSFLTLALIFALFAAPAHSADVTLAWDPNTEPQLVGYKVYYKTGSSGVPYDGMGASQGDSPIDVGNVTEFTLNGLTDGVIYFFAVTAYDTEGYETYYSNEVSTSELSMSDNAVEVGGGCFIGMAAHGPNQRVRDRREGKEVGLTLDKSLQKSQGVAKKGLRKTLCGLSWRRYRDCSEAIPEAFSLSPSIVSEKFIRASTGKLKEFMERRLDELDIVAIVINGKTFKEDEMIIALGVTIEGKKVLLGFIQAGIENAFVCREFLLSLLERGLKER